MEAPTKVMTAAVDLFLQYGFKAVTMDDVARRAGMSKKTLYQHFSNKQEVVATAVSWYQNLKVIQIKATVEAASNALEAIVRVDAELAEIYRKLNPLAMLELQRFYPEGWDCFRQVLLTHDVDIIRAVVQRGQTEGLFRPDIDPDLTARYRIETALMTMQPNLMVADRYSLMQVGFAITELFLYGIMTLKGQKLYARYKEQYCAKPTAKL